MEQFKERSLRNYAQTAALRLQSIRNQGYLHYVTKLQEIEAAIAQLPPADFAKLADWIDRKRETDFDRQIAADAASGRLDKLWGEAEKEIGQGKARPLDELLDD